MFSVSVVVLAAFLLPSVHGSAIPMWEYLSRGEKMSYLFNLFVHQVEKHCSTRPEPDCSKLLLVYGLTNLAKMEDESLDDMDPYQRGANEIVWDSMMKGSTKHNRIDEFASKYPTKNIQNSNSTPNSLDSSNNTDDLDVSEPGSLGAASDINEEEAEPQSFLLGPMVVRVLPNGMPIPGEKSHLPKDEDIEEFAPSTYHRFPVGPLAAPSKLVQGGNKAGSFDRRYDYKPSYHNARFYRQQPPQQYSSPGYRMRSPDFLIKH